MRQRKRLCPREITQIILSHIVGSASRRSLARGARETLVPAPCGSQAPLCPTGPPRRALPSANRSSKDTFFPADKWSARDTFFPLGNRSAGDTFCPSGNRSECNTLCPPGNRSECDAICPRVSPYAKRAAGTFRPPAWTPRNTRSMPRVTMKRAEGAGFAARRRAMGGRSNPPPIKQIAASRPCAFYPRSLIAHLGSCPQAYHRPGDAGSPIAGQHGSMMTVQTFPARS